MITGFVIFLQTDQKETTDYELSNIKRNSLSHYLTFIVSHTYTHIPSQNKLKNIFKK